jgi:hypothetical protein
MTNGRENHRWTQMDTDGVSSDERLRLSRNDVLERGADGHVRESGSNLRSRHVNRRGHRPPVWNAAIPAVASFAVGRGLADLTVRARLAWFCFSASHVVSIPFGRSNAPRSVARQMVLDLCPSVFICGSPRQSVLRLLCLFEAFTLRPV